MPINSYNKAFLERLQDYNGIPYEDNETIDTLLLSLQTPIKKTFRTTYKYNNTRLLDGLQTHKTALDHTYFMPYKADITPIGKTLEHHTGQIYSGRLASFLAVHMLLDSMNLYGIDRDTSIIMDMCSSPGTKLLLLAERINSTIIALEKHPLRYHILRENINKMGLKNTITMRCDARYIPSMADKYDVIMLDAPCSNESHNTKDSRYLHTMWRENDVYTASHLQKELITAACSYLKKGGILLYSTCTTAPEENEMNVLWAMNTLPMRVLELPTYTTIPLYNALTSYRNNDFTSINTLSKRLWTHKKTDIWESDVFFYTLFMKL